MVKRKGIFRTKMEMAAHSSMVAVLEAVRPWVQQGSQGGTGFRGYTAGSQSRQCLQVHIRYLTQVTYVALKFSTVFPHKFP